MVAIASSRSDLDTLDRRIVALLREDGRRSYSEMARTIGMSVAAVKRRVGRLQDDGVICGYTAQLDYARLGWTVQAFVEVRYTGRTSVDDIIATASSVPEVQSVYAVAGELDALVQIRARDLPHMQTVLDQLRRAGTVTGTRTLMVLGSWSRS
jgi:DNA-binding Lrp family transcriptional regulator